MGAQGASRRPDSGVSLSLNSALMERLAEGVILLNPQAQVTDYNRAARPWLKACLAGAAALSQLLGKVAAGTVQLPLRVDSVFAPTASTTEFHLCKNEPHNFALLITGHQPPSAALPEVAAQDSFFFLLGEDFRHELSRLREQITLAAPDTAAQLARVQQQSGRLSRLLIAMEQLCELHEKDAFFQGERVNLQTLSEAVIAELPRRRGDFSINQAQSDAPDQQGMLFGDAGWLKIALKGLLEGIADTAPTLCQIEIRVRQSGGFVVLTGHFSQAFARAPGPPSRALPQSTLSAGPDTRIAICQRIVALHGGQLKIVSQPAAQADDPLRGIESFHLSLPTGAPLLGRNLAACTNCLAPRQAEQYARDLAALTSVFKAD